jgi:DNA-binding CsgD family transcriptional regulator
VRGGRRARRTRCPGGADPQQRRIVRLASDGLTDREIGDRLFLSPRTVNSHLYRSFPKLGVAGRHQLCDVITRVSTQRRRKPWHPMQATAQQQRMKHLGLP